MRTEYLITAAIVVLAVIFGMGLNRISECTECLKYENYCTITFQGSGIGFGYGQGGAVSGPVYSSSTEEVKCGTFKNEDVHRRCVDSRWTCGEV